ncbi:MAG: redox-regulated ATPase YchF [bacterium]|nr:redox-regulated ATPase YchF [bacterium]
MANISIGIVGLPNVGKSTLFKAITDLEINIANYPFATIDPNIGIVPVPDERVDKLAELSQSAKKIPAVVEFYDIAGLVRGANKGEGLGNQFLSHIREVDAIIMVLRCFQSGEIIHVENSVDPIRDMEIINTELALKDLDTVEKVLKRVEGEAKTGDKQAKKDLETIRETRSLLEKGEPLWQHSHILENVRMLGLSLLTTKKQLYLLNGQEGDVPPELIEKIKTSGADYIVADLSQSVDLSALIKKSYEILGLISFFTTGKDETRAWTIRQGSKAPQAAGVIHTDFEKKFIRAEVVNWQKLLEVGSWAQARQKGFLRIEGKEYVAEDGDVMEIRHG